MTTSVKIDAHAGWPVLVTLKHGEPNMSKSVSTERVEPHTERTFYIHSGLQIIGVEEMPIPGANIHGIGPDTAGGPNPHYNPNA